MKGIEPYDIEKAYRIIKASVLCEKELDGNPFRSDRPDCKQYIEDCYVPDRISNTLEYLLADYTSSRLAKKLGKAEDAKFFMNRAQRYRETTTVCSDLWRRETKTADFCSRRADMTTTAVSKAISSSRAGLFPMMLRVSANFSAKKELLSCLRNSSEKLIFQSSGTKITITPTSRVTI